MIPTDIFPFLTQVFFVSAVVTTAIMMVSLIYGKVTGQIVFKVEEAPSLFQLGKPNPSTEGKPMKWYEEQMKLFESETKINTRPTVDPSSRSAQTTEELSVKDFLPTGELKETPVEEAPEIPIETEEISVEEEKDETPFRLVEKTLAGTITEDVERVTPDGIPIKIAKGTEVKVLLPGFTIEEIGEEPKGEGKKTEKEEKKKSKQLGELEKDEELGTVS